MNRRGFTLLELLVVVGILAILMGLGAPMVGNAQKHARQADCRSNLRQFGIAITCYRSDHQGVNPPWMSSLYPEYIDDGDVYICKSDKNRGREYPVPEDLIAAGKATPYREIKDYGDNKREKTSGSDYATAPNSYFYEFSSAKCSWDSNSRHDIDGDGTVTWSESKEWQLRYGDEDGNGGGDPDDPKPYSTARMPIIRCWHHYNEAWTRGREQKGNSGSFKKQYYILNVGYAGNVFVSPPYWEGKPEAGEL